MGTYWAGLSSPHVVNIVENSDLMIFAGAILNDYTTVGWTALINPKTSVEMFPFKVIVCGKLYSNVFIGDLLQLLAARATKKEVD
jgi:TPP-dependent 2-oxoacid decarboxylase